MNDLQQVLIDVKRGIDRKEYAAAWSALSAVVAPESDFSVQTRAARLARTIPAMALGLRPIRIALLASCTVDHFTDVLKYWLARDGFAAEIWIAPFDTITPTVLDPDGELYAFEPDLVWLFTSARDVRLTAEGSEGVRRSVEMELQHAAMLWSTIQARLGCMILQNNADIPAIDSFGNFAGHTADGPRNGYRLYNLELAARAPAGVAILDLEHLSALFGKARWIDRSYWYHSKHPFSFDANGIVAFAAARLIAAMRGQARKCLVLDLDNTLWGGVIGDDGLAGIRLGNGADGEAFADFQLYARSLKERGIILAVCSKNDEQTAKEPFLKHPDCVLKLEDFAVFRANWDNKADNIRRIAETLNIGLDSLVFVDDNPVERNLVRELLPMVAVPELPDDPSLYIDAVDGQRYFETVSISADDRERTRHYQANSERATLQTQFSDISGYLRSLHMVATAGSLDDFHRPRIAQLINKSNQFNLSGIRRTEADLDSLAARPGTTIRHYGLKDRFGDNGLISVAILVKEGDAVLVDTWVMSCRVLGRTMEEFIHNDLLDTTRRMGGQAIVGRYVPSAKNGPVAALYQRLGFAKESDVDGTTAWRRSLQDAEPLATCVASAQE